MLCFGCLVVKVSAFGQADQVAITAISIDCHICQLLLQPCHMSQQQRSLSDDSLDSTVGLTTATRRGLMDVPEMET